MPPFDFVPDLVWQPDEVRAVWAEEGYAGLPLTGAAELTPLPQGQPFSFDAQRPALAARGLSEAEHELGGLLRQGLDVVVSFPHRGEALRQQQLMRRSEASLLEPGDSPAGLAFAVSPARRGFIWRDLSLALLPDTQVFRKRTSRATTAPGRALQSFSDLRTGDYVVHEDHGIAQLLSFETKEVADVTRDYLLLAFRGEDRVYVPSGVRVWIATGHTDMRRGMQGLALAGSGELEARSPCRRSLYLPRSPRRSGQDSLA